MSCVSKVDGIGSSCCGPSIEINLLKWKDCDTLDKKIGFILGRSINYTVSTVSTVANKTAKILHLSAAAELFFRVFKTVVSKLIQVIRQVAIAAFNGLKKVLKPVYEFADRVLFSRLRSIFARAGSKSTPPTPPSTATPGEPSRICQLCSTLKSVSVRIGRACLTGLRASFRAAKAISNRTIVPFYNHVVCPLSRKAFEFIKGPGLNAAKTAADWTVVPFFNRVVKPVFKKISSVTATTFNAAYTNVAKVVKPVLNRTVVPLYTRVISPSLKAVGNIFWGTISGCFGKKEAKPVEDKEQTIAKDANESIANIVTQDGITPAEEMPFDLVDFGPKKFINLAIANNAIEENKNNSQ